METKTQTTTSAGSAPKQSTSQSEVKETSSLVSLKTSGKVMGSVLSFALVAAAASLFPQGATQASLLENIDETVVQMVAPSIVNFLAPLLIFTMCLFIGIFILYILAKTEGQKHGNYFHNNSRTYAYRNFPSIFVIEASTMMYVVFVLLTAILFITKLKYDSIIFSSDENVILLAASGFAVLGGALSHLYYFLNKVTPEQLDDEGVNLNKNKSIEFDVNRVLRYLSFPFMSAGMGIMAYVLVKGSGAMLGIQAFITPSFWILMLMALIAGYFSNLFIEMFHSIVQKMKGKVNSSTIDNNSFSSKKIA